MMAPLVIIPTLLGFFSGVQHFARKVYSVQRTQDSSESSKSIGPERSRSIGNAFAVIAC